MKKFIIFPIFIFVLILLSSCGNQSSNNSCGANKNHFVFATWAAGDELKEFNQIVDKVNAAANGEYTIETLSIPSDYYVKLSTLIAANKSPDFFWMTQELVSKYAKLGAIADLTDFLNNSQSLQPSEFYPGVLASATYDGKYYGVPWIANPLMVYYNKDLFDEAGVPYPSATDNWTWQDFIDTAKKLTVVKKDSSNHDYQQYGYIVDGWPNIETFLWAGGGDVIAPNGQDVLLDSAGSIAGLGILDEILKSGITPTYAQVSSLGSNNVWFEKQRAAMFMGGIQDNFEQKVSKMPDDEKFNIGYAPMPVGLDGTASAFDWTASTVMKKQCGTNDLANKALEAMTLEFFKWKIASPLIGQVGEIANIDPLKVPALPTIEYSLSIARSAYYTPEWNEINNLLWVDLYSTMLNNPNFDYTKEIQDIAQKSRDFISQRK